MLIAWRPLMATIALGLAWGVAASSDATNYYSSLDAVAFTMETRALVTGRGSVQASRDGSRTAFRGHFAGLAAPATRVTVRLGNGVGVPGREIAALPVAPSLRAGSFQGTLELSAAQLAGLSSGHVYVRIDTETAPEGALWGWLLPHPAGRPGATSQPPQLHRDGGR